MNTASAITRRDSLERLGTGALLALGLWPGTLRAAQSSASFRFIVVNDTHYMTPQCGAWIEGAVRQMKNENAEFCLHAGDLVDKGDREGLESVREIFSRLGVPFYPVIGNHDYLTQSDRQNYEKTFPKRLNYAWTHQDWQFVALDSSDGLRFEKTSIQPDTFAWIDDHLRALRKERPTVILTHFPLGEGVNYRPLNADWLLDRFREFNLKAVFSGHFHGFTEREAGPTVLTTNQCCALKRDNHDGTKEKGYFVCSVKDGQIDRRFVEYRGI